MTVLHQSHAPPVDEMMSATATDTDTAIATHSDASEYLVAVTCTFTRVLPCVLTTSFTHCPTLALHACMCVCVYVYVCVGEEKTSFAHNFKRDTASLTCFACCDSWAPSKTAVCVCYVCTVCGE